MKVLFLLDDGEYVVVEPTQLILSQMSEGLVGLGVNVSIPSKDDKGEVVIEDGVPKRTTAFRQFLSFNVNIAVPEPLKSKGVKNGRQKHTNKRK
jgi:hypothetical protein